MLAEEGGWGRWRTAGGDRKAGKRPRLGGGWQLAARLHQWPSDGLFRCEIQAEYIWVGGDVSRHVIWIRKPGEMSTGWKERGLCMRQDMGVWPNG